MRDPDQQPVTSVILVLGMLIGLAVGQFALADSKEVALADSKELAAKPAASIPTPDAAAAPLTGRQVYKTVCIACHAPPGIGGAPPLGDGDAWAPHIAKGVDTLIDHALHGFTGDNTIMPRKGGREDLSDEEIVAAVKYMVGQATQ